MKPSEIAGKNNMFHKVLSAIMMAVAITAISVPADAQRNRDKDQKAEGRVLSSKVGENVLKAQEALQLQPPQYNIAIAALSKVLAMENLTPYERAISLQMRGQAYYGVKQVSRTLSDWEAAIRTGAMTPDEVNGLKPNIGQLYISEGQVAKGANILEDWLRSGGKGNERIYMMLASAWAQIDQYRKALPHAERAFNMASPKKKKHFGLLNYLYNSLKLYGKQAALLEQQVSIWPDDKKIWKSIASLKQQAKKSKDAFEINKIMYLNGMLTSERELLGLCQYYSYYEVPYRGARIMEREMNGGRISKSQKNLKLLSDMWRQAREYDKAIPVLTQAANIASDGKLYEQLGEAYFAENRYAEAESAFRKALGKGGLKKPGNIHVLIANTLYERDKVNDALKEFQKGTQYSYSRKSAKGWIQFIESGFEVERKKKAFLIAVKLDECKNQEDRLRRLGDTRIEGMEVITEECKGILAADKARVKAAREKKKANAT